MASIRQLENGKYQATISCGRDANGKQIRKYVTHVLKKECEALAKKIEIEFYEGKFVNYKNVRLSVWMDEWLKLNEKRLSPSTYITYKIYVDAHFKDELGNYKLSQLNEIHLRRYMNKKLDTLSPTTVRKHMLVLRRILQDVLKDKNPAKDIKIPSPNDFMPHIVSDEELQIILSKAKGTRHEPIILLAAWCGLRRGEIFALKWNDIDEKQGVIKVDESRSLSNKGYVDKQPKSHNGTRLVAAPQYLFDLLNAYRKKQKSISDRIFPERPDNYTHRFAELIKDVKLENIRFHDLRHYHATWLYKQNVPDHYAAGRLGHDIQTLKRIYQHIDKATIRDIDKNIVQKISNT